MARLVNGQNFYIYILCPCSNMAILPDCANSIVGQDEWSKIWFNQLSPKWTNYDANVPFCSSSSSSSFFLLAFCIFAYWQVPLYNKSESSQNVVVIITAFISLCHLWIKLEQKAIVDLPFFFWLIAHNAANDAIP